MTAVLSAQCEITQLPASAPATVGVVCAAPLTVSAAIAVSAGAIVALRYPATSNAPRTKALVVTVTGLPASPACAVRVHNAVVIWPAAWVRTLVQPAGSAAVTVPEFQLSASTSTSPACTDAGTVTWCDWTLPDTVSAAPPTNSIAASLTSTECDSWSMPPSLSVTVSSTG